MTKQNNGDKITELGNKVRDLLETPISERAPSLETLLRRKLESDLEILEREPVEHENPLIAALMKMGNTDGIYDRARKNYETAQAMPNLPHLEGNVAAELDMIEKNNTYSGQCDSENAYRRMEKVVRREEGIQLKTTYTQLILTALSQLADSTKGSEETEILRIKNPNAGDLWNRVYPFRNGRNGEYNAATVTYSIGSLEDNGIRSKYLDESGEPFIGFALGGVPFLDDCGPDLRLAKQYFDAIETYAASKVSNLEVKQ